MVQHASSRAADPAAAADALRQQIVAENSATAINGQAETADAVYGASTIKRVRRTKSAIATIREAIHVVPSRPTKTTDTRAKKFVGTSVELDAIPVQKLRGLARACIEQHVDQEQLAILKVAETSERETLTRWAGIVNGVRP